MNSDILDQPAVWDRHNLDAHHTMTITKTTVRLGLHENLRTWLRKTRPVAPYLHC